MGKGDKKSKRGKIIQKSYGVRRPRRKTVHTAPVAAVKEEMPAKPVKEKAPAKPKTEVIVAKEEAPVINAVAESAEKPAKKKSAPKAKATPKKEKDSE